LNRVAYAIQSSGRLSRNGWEANTLPHKFEHQTFLLNRENKVIALGNPVYNPKIKELYGGLVFDSIEPELVRKDDSLICKHTVRPLGVVNRGDTVCKLFRLNNDTKGVLTIQETVPSCHCINGAPVSPSGTIPTGEHTDIKVTYVADTVPQPFYQYVDVYFKERARPLKLILHGFLH